MSQSKKIRKDILQSPKGMRDFFNDAFYAKQGFYKKAEEIAEYHGFSGIETPIMEYEEIFEKGVGDNTDIVEKEMYSLTTKGGDHLVLRPEGTAAVMRSYIEHGMGSFPQPVFLYYGGPFFRHDKPQKGRYRQLYQFGLEIIGSDKPEQDAFIIQTGYQVLKETKRNIIVKINTLGDAEVRNLYLKKLITFYTENKEKISPKDLVRLETNPLRILDSKEPETKKVNEQAPTCISTLNEQSKIHFDSLLHYLNEAQIPYEIDHTLVRGLDYYTHTVFEYVVYDDDGNPSLALGGGGRYDGLAKTMGHTKEVPAVGLALGVDRIIELTEIQHFISNIKRKPKFFFIQLDDSVQGKAFEILELLRMNQYPVYHAQRKNNLGMHLGTAESLAIPYALILGQEEMKNNTVIVRDMKKREQETIALDSLVKYLSNLQ